MVDDFPIKSVWKAMAILDALGAVRCPLRIGELASQLNMSASAVSRLVATLASGGLVHQDDDTGRCYLGLGLTVLGASALGRRELDRVAMPVLDELARNTGLYVSLSRIERGSVVVMRARSTSFSPRDINLFSVVPIHASAPGKVLATALDVAELRAILDEQGMDPLTARTCTDPDAFITEVNIARTRGYAVETEEIADNLRHVATGVYDQHGRIVATISAGGVIADLPDPGIESVVRAIRHGALNVSREIGFCGALPGDCAIAQVEQA